MFFSTCLTTDTSVSPPNMNKFCILDTLSEKSTIVYGLLLLQGRALYAVKAAGLTTVKLGTALAASGCWM
jgi:hypothetical protein